MFKIHHYLFDLVTLWDSPAHIIGYFYIKFNCSSCKNYDRKQSNGYIEIVTTKSNMNYSFSTYHGNISLIVFVVFVSLIIVHQYILPTIISKVQSSSVILHQIYAQQPSNNITTANNNIEKYPQKECIITKATGHFANNQIKDGMVSWIQGGLWDLKIKCLPHEKSLSLNDKSNLTAVFNASFTMIKPDGSLSHNHLINNFSSTNVIFAGNDIIITGIADIHSNIGIEYKQVPITVHLMGKKVLGLMIDVAKTKGHFASPNEMYGTLISGIGLDNSNTNKTNNANINTKT